VSEDNLIQRLRSITQGELRSALEQDGFKRTHGSVYAHDDGRITVLHFHRSHTTLTRKTLKTFLEGTQWTEVDARRLGLLT